MIWIPTSLDVPAARRLEWAPPGTAHERIKFIGAEVALVEAEDVAIGGNDDRRWNRRKVEGRYELFILIGAKLERQKRALRMLDDRRMRERIALHPGAIGAPRTRELDP